MAPSTTPEEAEAVVDAARRGDVAAVEAWLDSGGSPDVADGLGFTPLMCAAAQGRLELVSRLLKAGADAFLQCHALPKRGWTALDFAMATQEEGIKTQTKMELPQVIFLLSPKDAIDDDERWDPAVQANLPPQFRR